MSKIYVNNGKVKEDYYGNIDTIETLEDDVKEYNKKIALMERFISSDIGKAIKVFCDGNKKGEKNLYQDRLKEINKMIKYSGFDIKINEHKFELFLDDYSQRYYPFDNFDAEKDLENLKNRYEKAVKKLKYEEKRMDNTKYIHFDNIAYIENLGEYARENDIKEFELYLDDEPEITSEFIETIIKLHEVNIPYTLIFND